MIYEILLCLCVCVSAKLQIHSISFYIVQYIELIVEKPDS